VIPAGGFFQIAPELLGAAEEEEEDVAARRPFDSAQGKLRANRMRL
jgi:hypothetical protein